MADIKFKIIKGDEDYCEKRLNQMMQNKNWETEIMSSSIRCGKTIRSRYGSETSEYQMVVLVKRTKIK